MYNKDNKALPAVDNLIFTAYFNFLREYSPIKTDIEYKENAFIEKLLDKLSRIFNAFDVEERKQIAKKIFMIYPSFFSLIRDDEYKAIGNDMTMILSSLTDRELQQRIALHLSYYQKEFPRFSREFVAEKDNGINVSYFVLKKPDNNQYQIVIGSSEEIIVNFTTYKSINDISNNGLDFDFNCFIDFEQDKDDSNPLFKIKEFDLESCDNNEDRDRLKTISDLYFSETGSNELKYIKDISVINDDKEKGKEKKIYPFLLKFEEAIYSHLQMLEKAQLMYVFSQTAKVSRNGSNSNIGYGGLFILFSKEITDYDFLQNCFQLYSDVISTRIAHNEIIESRHKEALKSAIAAIMSRNMSHNLGSHVLFYIKEHLKSVKTIFKDKILAELINETIDDMAWDDNSFSLKQKIKEIIDRSDEKDKDELPFLVGLGRFISYLQERQDYIATVCTDYVPYFSTVDFKKAIYDELTPDACQARHSDRKGEKPENLLLKYIAKSEGFGRKIEGEENNKNYEKNNIVIYFREFNGLDKKHEELKNMRGIKLSLPGGYTGRQAFFSIFENIIRNAAKHGKLQSRSTDLEFTIDAWNEESLETLKKRIDKEHDIKEKKTLQEEYSFWRKYESVINDLWIITITDNCEIDNEILENLKESLDENYLDGNGKLKETNKGLKEMRISATWLRNESYLENSNDKNKILQVRKTSKNYLQYVFCIQRPKEIAFVIDSEIDNYKTIQRNLQKKYCKLFSSNEFIKDTKLNYNFIVCESSAVYRQILPHSHSLIIADNELCKKINNINDDNINNKKIIEQIKENFFEKFLNFNNINKICISDSKVKLNPISRPNEKYLNIIIGGDINEKYIYKTHFESTKEFYEFMKKNFFKIKEKQIEFIEGITGHNSTDRLIRTEELDKLWYYKHINAIKTKVAIFDERFFERYTKISHNDLIGKEEFETPELAPYLYKLKGVEFFNIVWHNIKCKFVIVAYSHVEHSLKDAELEYEYKGCVYNIIGTISKVENNVKITFINDYHTKFDFICIHQGLLDKIYAQFDIKKADLKNRAQVTKEIYDNFSIKTDNTVPVKIKIKEKEFDYDYLPKLIIHSGRSKPSNDDMPQYQPFVQFSALENVIADCKYSLVELLNMAHYE